MTLIRDYLKELFTAGTRGWNRFWFTPEDAATLSLIRVLAGAMLLYTHLVWGLRLNDFFGSDGWLPPESVARFQQPGPTIYGPATFAWSLLWLADNSYVLWGVHLLALASFALLTVGLWTRVASVAAAVFAISYVNRAPGALFGLDQINTLLAIYLAVGPAGAYFSIDARRARQRAGLQAAPRPTVGANIAIRLIQLHMCVIYLFAGLSKLAGPRWWDGTALWGAFANLEYQSLDMLWMVHWPLVVNLLTLTTLVWEISYCALVWNRLARPIVILLAVPLHMGIAISLGMITFGLAMIFGNMAFISPSLVRRYSEWPWTSAEGGGSSANTSPVPSGERQRLAVETSRPSRAKSA